LVKLILSLIFFFFIGTIIPMKRGLAMPCRVHQLNKTTGITYVYESVSYWDKKKKQARNKKVCIGKLSPVDGVFIASKRLQPEQAAARDPIVTASAEIIGPCIILDTITEQLGLGRLLKSCFPQEHSQIQAMAYYLVSQGGPLSYCETWCKVMHTLPNR
jgi:hypothetical protein